jgi:hypothetical protein
MGLIFSVILATQYNQAIIMSNDTKQTRRQFLISWAATIGVFILALLVMPHLLPYTKVFITIGGILTLTLLFLLILFIIMPATRQSVQMFLVIFLFIFLIFIFTDMVTIVGMCKKPSSWKCDPILGATTIYLDMINILQKMFMLMNNNGRDGTVKP